MKAHVLILVRHAQARFNPSVPDRVRHLSIAGQDQADRLGVALGMEVHRVDQVFVSPATRTRETAEHVISHISPAPELNEQECLYLAGAEQVINVARCADEDYNTVMIVGHEPAIASAATILAATNKQRDLVRLGIPTGTALVLRFEGRWSDIPFGGCDMTYIHQEAHSL